jgi:PleD family two-component response regulator
MTSIASEDGREMCKQKKSLAEHKHIPIILISADDDSLKSFKEYEADSFLKNLSSQYNY